MNVSNVIQMRGKGMSDSWWRRLAALSSGLLVALVVACAVPESVSAKPSAGDKMQLGELMFFNGNIDGAINAFRQALVLDPKLWTAHLNLVNMYIQKQDFPTAIEECREVLKIKPGNRDVHLILGNLLRAQNDLDGAAEHLKAAIDNGASPAMAHNALGLTLLQKGDFNGAEEHITAALDKQKKFPDAHLTLGVVKFKKNDKEGALKEFDMAVQQKGGKYPEAHNAKGDILAAGGSWKEALVEYQKAAEEDPKYAQAHANVANAYFQLNDLDKAREAYLKARELNPQDKNILYGLALMYEKTDRIPEALAEFQNAVMLETDPEMSAKINLHMQQLRTQGGMQFSLGGLGSSAPTMPGLYQNINPFGTSFSDMIKIKPPPGHAAAKQEKSETAAAAKKEKSEAAAAAKQEKSEAAAAAKQEKSDAAATAKQQKSEAAAAKKAKSDATAAQQKSEAASAKKEKPEGGAVPAR